MNYSTNPYLPQYEYIPDGEPHLFEGRVYIYGSHDRPHGTKYCEGDYVTWSAPEDDLSNWRYEGVIYRRTQDPSNPEDQMQLWAPDVTRGPDGRYYLYYCFSFYPEIGVAVSDSPAGPFEFYGHVQYPDGRVMGDFMPFDPAVLTDDDGRVYLYYGFATKEQPLGGVAEAAFDPSKLSPEERAEMEKMRKRFAGRPRIQLSEGGMAVELEPDMLTVKAMPHVCTPGLPIAEGTGFEGHAFFEASSIRKVNGKYYFVYSSQKSHELCYAVSDKPTEGFVYGGTIVSNGDIGLDGREIPVMTVGNNHGGMVQANGQWYIFYHRQTNGTEFSRQGCAEPITIADDGSIAQVEITSMGPCGQALPAPGCYSAGICCHLTSPDTSAVINYRDPNMQQMARITTDPADPDAEQYITAIMDGVTVGYKYFDCRGIHSLTLQLRGQFAGTVTLSADADATHSFSTAAMSMESDHWIETTLSAPIPDGVTALYLHFAGIGQLDLKQLELHP